MLLGENVCWSLLGPKGIKSLISAFTHAIHKTGAPNENVVQNHLNIVLLNVF